MPKKRNNSMKIEVGKIYGIRDKAHVVFKRVDDGRYVGYIEDYPEPLSWGENGRVTRTPSLGHGNG